jgi:hypothetical protein
LNKSAKSIAERIEVIESSYAFMLAYAAQGRETEEGLSGSPSLRETLAELSTALIDLSDSVLDMESATVIREFADTLSLDAAHARRAVDLVLSRARISSQLVDNLNATIHLRSVLTDLFLIDEALQCQNSRSQEQDT